MRLPIVCFPIQRRSGPIARPTGIAAFALGFAIPFSNSPLLLPDILAPVTLSQPPAAPLWPGLALIIANGEERREKNNEMRQTSFLLLLLFVFALSSTRLESPLASTPPPVPPPLRQSLSGGSSWSAEIFFRGPDEKSARGKGTIHPLLPLRGRRRSSPFAGRVASLIGI